MPPTSRCVLTSTIGGGCVTPSTRLLPRIARFAEDTRSGSLCDEATRLFYVTHSSPDSDRSARPAFESWFALAWVPVGVYDLLRAEDKHASWSGTSLGVTWLASAPSVSDFERSFILTAARSPHSLLLVESVWPGSCSSSVILTGRRFRVTDPEMSKHVQPDDVLFSAVLTLDGVSTLLGCASQAVDADVRDMAWATRECEADGAWLTRSSLLSLTPELASDYRCAYDGEAVQDTETYGAEPVSLLVRWRVSTPIETAFWQLHPLCRWYADEEALYDETQDVDDPHLCLSWYELPPPPERDARRPLAHLYLDRGPLATRVATRALANRLIEEVDARLGTAATLVEIRTSGPLELDAQPRADAGGRQG